ncbi:LysE family translocator [Iamia sp. SCSIO 61187]|uniref:LysE family translocator n=1 Tax=Iamia sp. SCSIO 61187 TaxID=2722752 RepID=UPI001C632FCF|nr:LysE family translocator [Iamia sp. SCSIO 61187]QYG95010.1 LysE family translocator [Iamia sp. SCSIO 61187]
MVSTHALVTFAATASLLIVVPGPSVMFVVSRGVALGRRAAVLTVVGNAAGAYTQVILVAAGLGALVQRSVAVYTAVKLVGAAYLVYLGVQAFRHRRALHLTAGGVVPARSYRRLLLDGYVVGVANPKVIVFFAAILTQFVDPDGGPVPLQMAVLGLIFVGIALVSDGAWGLMAGTARGWLARSPRRLSTLGGTGGLVMVGLGVRLALSGRAD